MYRYLTTCNQSNTVLFCTNILVSVVSKISCSPML
jgi:hypothetical protein